MSNINNTISNYTPTQGFFSVLSKYLVLDTIVDPIFLSKDYFNQSGLKTRKIKIKNKEEELNSTQALIRFWEESFGLSVPNRWFRDSNKDQKSLIELPRNTLIGRRLNLANESPQNASGSEFLLPFFSSHLSLPCKPGEVVWVFKQSNMAEHQKYAWWVSKVVEPGIADDVNFLPPERNKDKFLSEQRYTYGNSLTKKDGQQDPRSMKFVTNDPQLIEKIALNTPGGKQTIKEPVPRFKKRPGDLVLEGSNNTLIVLGTDRESAAFNKEKLEELSLNLCQNVFEKASSTSVEIKYEEKLLPSEDEEKNAGSIDLVAGRKNIGEVNSVISTRFAGDEISKEVTKEIEKLLPSEGDPDLIRDSSRVLISQRTKIDKKTKLDAYNKSNSDIGIQDSIDGDPSILLKSDKIRVVGRKDVQIIVKDDNGEDTTSVSAKSDGSITVKSKSNFTLKIDKDGKVNLDANGDVVINPGPGLIKLGGEGANNAVLCQTAGAPIIGSMGTAFGGGGTFGVFSSKVRVI